MWKKRKPSFTLGGNVHLYNLRKLNIGLPYDQAIPLLGIYPDKTTMQKDSCMPLFIAALFTIAKTWKQPQCPSTEEWIQRCGKYTQWNITQP